MIVITIIIIIIILLAFSQQGRRHLLVSVVGKRSIFSVITIHPPVSDGGQK